MDYILETFDYTMYLADANLRFDILSEDNSIKYESAEKSFKEKINKLTSIVINYINTMKKIITLYIDKLEIHHGMKVIEKMIKCCPKVAKETINFREYMDNKKDDKYYTQMAKNFITRINAKENQPHEYDILNRYHSYKSKSDNTYKISIEDCISYFKYEISSIDKNIHENIKTLFSVRKLLDNKDNNNYINLYARISKEMSESVSNRMSVFISNISMLFTKVNILFKNSISNDADKYIQKKEPDIKTLMNSAQLKTKMKVCDVEFNIYETKYKNVSCFNYLGNNIYVDNGFFDMPKPYQHAILYHEMGHKIMGHYDNNKIQNEKKQLKNIKKDMKKYDSNIKNCEWESDRLTSDDELIYILVELEADRFSKKMVGKNVLMKSLRERFNKTLVSYSDDKDNIDFNNFRMKLRTKMI